MNHIHISIPISWWWSWSWDGTSRKTWWNCAGLFLKSTRHRYEPRSESFRFSGKIIVIIIHDTIFLANFRGERCVSLGFPPYFYHIASTRHRYEAAGQSLSGFLSNMTILYPWIIYHWSRSWSLPSSSYCSFIRVFCSIENACGWKRFKVEESCRGSVFKPMSESSFKSMCFDCTKSLKKKK